jgi:DNA mismatch repair protein MutS2
LKLVDLPGIGSRIRERLLEHFGSEECALETIMRGDVAALVRVLSERQALSLAQCARGLSFGARPDEFLATDEAVNIYQRLVSRIAGYAHTDYARLKIGTLFPSSSPELLALNRKVAQESMESARLLDQSEIHELLGKIRPLREKAQSRVRERAVATTSAEDFQRLKARGLDKLIDLHLAESPRELMDLARSYSHVSLVGDEQGDIPGIEAARSQEDWYLVPEAVLGFYIDNLEALSAAVKAARRLQQAGLAGFESIDGLRGFKDLDDIERLICGLGQGYDAEALRLSQLLSSLSPCAERAVSWANSELKKKIEGSSVTLDGTDLLSLMAKEDGVRDLFEVQMRGVFQDVLKQAKGLVSSELDLAGPEAVWLDEIFSSEVCYPIEIERKAIVAFEQELRIRRETRELDTKRKIARGLADKRERLKELVFAIMEFDFFNAIGSFALAEGLVMPEITDRPCLIFEEGRNLFLERPEAVSYALGSSDHPERIAVLSGVNSGGKTSLLDLVAQIAILAHMGLPVPAALCSLGTLQEMYYFSKSRGTLSAGAFETAMRKFAIVENQKRKLVLADELESITEPGASARIIACMLDDLNRRDCAAVFVSHLAEEVKRFAETPVRVDGIEASGLDEENRLIVNRSPRYNYLARSTPELILDRLVRSTKGPEREFYARLLAKFR